MTADFWAQLDALCQALLLGGTLGLLYDLMRVVRVRTGLGWLGQGLDLLFWLMATGALFCWSDRAWGGPVRLYGALFCLGGGALYFRVLSPAVLWMGYRIADFLTVILKILLIPLSGTKMGTKKVKNIIKNSFLFRAEWYRIGQKTIEMDGAVQRRAQRKEGERHGVFQQGKEEARQSADQGGRHGTAGVSVNLRSERPQ